MLSTGPHRVPSYTMSHVILITSLNCDSQLTEDKLSPNMSSKLLRITKVFSGTAHMKTDINSTLIHLASLNVLEKRSS